MTPDPYLCDPTPSPECSGDCPICQLGVASIHLSRLPDGQWRSCLWLTGSDELGEPDAEGFGPTSISAVALSLRGAGAGPDYDVGLAAALVLMRDTGHPCFTQLDPVKPFPWFTLCVFAPTLAAAVVAGVWLILKSF